jgi:hypothetical protein
LTTLSGEWIQINFNSSVLIKYYQLSWFLNSSTLKTIPNNWVLLGSNTINANWMFDGFNSGEVRTSYLINQYTWIRQREISEADLKKVKNKSEIQFLAMWVATSAGYHFREVVEFDKDQLAFLLPKEPYLAEAVAKDFCLDTQIIVDLDLVNLRRLHKSLKMK